MDSSNKSNASKWVVGECRAGVCGPEGRGSRFTADSFYVSHTVHPAQSI